MDILSLLRNSPGAQAWLAQQAPASALAAVGISPREALDREMSYDGSHPRQQEQAARDHFRSYGPQTLADAFIPGYGAGGDAKAASEAYGEGRYGAAALNAGMAALDFVPGLGIFAGAASKAADMAKLARAQKMADAGADKRAIWDETGWFTGADGKWRYEIDDSVASVGDYVRDGLIDGEPRVARADQAIVHPELYAAYPDLASVPTQWTPGALQPSGAWRTHESGAETMIANAGSSPQARDVGLHELQHGVQHREGFARGGSSKEYARGPMFDKRAEQLKSELSRAIYGTSTMPPEEIVKDIRFIDPQTLEEITRRYGFNSADEAVEFLSYQNMKRTPEGQYRRMAGEVEARNVQARRDFTPEQRRASPPWETEDVPLKDQIVRFLTNTGAQ